MQINRPILTQHRVQRLVLWALTLLHWLAAVLFSDREIMPRHLKRLEEMSLPALRRMVCGLIAAHALNLHRASPSRGRPPAWHCSLGRWRRALNGSKLRRALKHKDIAVQIEQLIAVLRDIDKWGAYIARRIASGMRRLIAATPPIAPCDMPCASPRVTPAIADSS